MESGSIIQKYISKLRFSNKSELTIRQYEPRLRALDKYLSINCGTSIDSAVSIREVTGLMLEEWQQWLRDVKKAGSSTEAAFVAAIKSFFVWATNAGLVDRNPALSLISIHVVKREQPHLEWSDVEKLIEKYESRDRVRDVCILAIGFIMGLRVSAISGLNISDIGDKKLRYKNKGGAIVTAYIPDEIKILIDKHIKENRFGAGADEPLFVSREGTRITVRTIERMCDKAGLSVGQKLTPHAMRRSCLSRIDEIAGTEMAQVVASHASKETTRGYIYGSEERMDELYSGMKIFSFNKKDE